MTLNGCISIRQQAEDGRPGPELPPDITNAQLERLCKCSPLLERHWLRLQRNLDPNIHPTRKYNWSLSCSEVDGGAIRTVFEKVSNPQEDGEWLRKRVDVRNLSRYCGAFWYLQIVPKRLPSYDEWMGHDSICKKGILNGSTPISSPTASSSQGHHRSAPSSSTISAQSTREESITTKLHVSLATARAALVLGQKDRFQDEIKFFLSMVPGCYLEERATPIKLLRLKHLEDIRLRELGGIENKIKSHIMEDKAATEEDVKLIESRLPDLHDETLSISGYRAMFRDDVFGAPSSPREAAMPINSDNRPPPGSGDRYIGRLDRLGMWVSKIRGSPADSEPSSVTGKLLVALDEHISGLLQKTADEIWDWRELKVKKWQDTLDEDERNEVNYLEIDAQTVATGD